MRFFRGLGPRNLLIALHDVIVSISAVVLSFYLRFQENALLDRLPIVLKILPYFAVLTVVVCYACHLTTTKWRFVSFPDFLNIGRAATFLAVSLLILDYIFVAPDAYGTFFLGKTTIVIYWMLEVFFLSGSRLIYRYFRYSRTLTRTNTAGATPALIVGRTADVEVLLRSIESGAVKNLRPVGIISPSIADRGQLIRGVSVVGIIEDLPGVLQDFSKRERPIQRLVLTPSAFEPASEPESVLKLARKLGLMVSQLPSLEEHRGMPRLAPIAIEDLLLRPSAKINYENLETLIKNKAVIVTGGGGSIGSEICDRVIAFGAARLLIVENSEPALYAVTENLSGGSQQVIIEGRIADIRDRDRMFALMQEFKPDLVFHAAALKHVPILERDWTEGVKTNIFGTINVADAAAAAHAEAMVMISTDKAIEPVSMLGLTKRFAEMYCQMLDRERAARRSGGSAMRLISVRFGNVLGSNGSVVPKFKAQIEAGGPVTVTHPDMVRYFMTIREACDLVISAAVHALTTDGGDDVSVYVLNMGQPVKIVDLAERMIKLSGLEPHKDIDIAFTGMRQGERLHEILFAEGEPTRDIGVPGVMAAVPMEPKAEAMRSWIASLEKTVAAEDRTAIRSLLKQAVPEFKT